MKKISLLLVALLFVVFTGCEEEDTFPFDTKGATIAVSNAAGFFDLTNLSSTFSFDASSLGEAVNSFDILKSYNGGTPVFHATVNSLPTSISITPAEAVQGLGVTVDDLQIGDEITFSFDNVVTSSGSYPSGAGVAAAVSCFSALAGTHTYTTTTSGWCTETSTGSVVWSEVGPGAYAIDDFAFGTYVPCYSSANTPDGTLQVNDVCNGITITGASQWGEIYSWTISDVNGPTMVITWSNDYGEGGITTLTNGNGEDWPPLYTP